jgi:hypothetical protein
VLLERITMHDYYSSPRDASHEECLMVTGIDGITIRSSRFYRCEDFDILFKRYGTNQMERNITIENSWFAKPYPDGTSAIQFSPDGDSFTNVTIRYNSFAATLTMKDQIKWANTQVIANVGANYGGPCGGGVTSAYNVFSGTPPCSSTDRRAPRGFVDEAGLDFHLAPGAAAIGRGDPSSHPAIDIDGEPRPQGGVPDAGADERP